jgi:putative polyhydroxyalkanoate system protein
MSEITIRRKHGKTPEAARASAEHMACELQEEFDLSYTWDGDLMRFKRPGISGELALDDEEVALRIHLSFFLSALKPTIEREVHKFFDENFAA